MLFFKSYLFYNNLFSVDDLSINLNLLSLDPTYHRPNLETGLNLTVVNNVNRFMKHGLGSLRALFLIHV